MHALPHESNIDPKNPMMNSLLLNTSTDCQYQEAPNMMIRMLEKHEVAKETVIASKPTLADVKCLMNKPEATKKHGVRIPKSTATHLGK
jgi:hypothetical protein